MGQNATVYFLRELLRRMVAFDLAVRRLGKTALAAFLVALTAREATRLTALVAGRPLARALLS